MLEQQEQKEQQELKEQEAAQEKEQIEQLENQIQDIVDSVVSDKDSYQQIYASLSSYVSELNRCMVTVTCINSDVDLLNNIMESSDQSFGVIIANNEIELLILSSYTNIKDAEKLSVTFHNEKKVPATVKEIDTATNLCVLAVNLSELSLNMQNTLVMANLGTSNNKSFAGVPVIAMGAPMGSVGSIGYGMVTSYTTQYGIDMNYKILQTDIYGSQYASGVLFNLQGEIIGVIKRNRAGSDMRNMVTAYGISDLRKIIEKMSNGKETAYMGITGMDVSYEANIDLGLPYGAYVREVEMDSPAMLAGVQKGDVIVEIGGRKIAKYAEYTAYMMGFNPGETIEVTLMRLAQDEYKEMNLNITLRATDED